MTEKEKVIRGLKCCDYCNSLTNTCFQCPYLDLSKEKGMAICTAELAHDALNLLREQEPVLVEHKKVDDGYQAIEDDFVCKHCGAWWMIPEQDLKYCPGCGRAVKWDA